MATPHWQIPVDRMDDGYDTLIDVRSPAEFAQDHIPGAINCPVLSDAERITVGTLYKQASPFEARKLGAVLVARNIARHIEQQFHPIPKNWRPLVYCWRGGQRSGAMQIVLRQIGWQADQLQGGYKAFRHRVMVQTTELAPQLRWHVICGPTGSAKTRILQSIARQGGQALDLEGLAAHKGSVLGGLPHTPQPGQKWFETLLWQQLRQFNPQQPVFVEAESRKIGNLHVPEPLIQAIRQGTRLEVQAPLQARINFLLRDYPYAQTDTAWLQQQLQRLTQRKGHQIVAHWQELALQGNWPQLVQELLEQHYDPLYRQSQQQNFCGQSLHAPLSVQDLSDASIVTLAQKILQGV